MSAEGKMELLIPAQSWGRVLRKTGWLAHSRYTRNMPGDVIVGNLYSSEPHFLLL